jgi:hypothetical protein
VEQKTVIPRRVTVLALAVVAYPVFALAADAFGVIKDYDAKSRILNLDNGMEFGVDEHVKFDFAVGSRIRVSYSDDHGILTAYAVVSAPPPVR